MTFTIRRTSGGTGRPTLPAGARIVAAAGWMLAVACGSTSPTPVGLAGQWSGTTSQGRPITFTISADEKVTAMTLEFSFNGCSGSHTFSNLALETRPDVICIPGPCSPSVSSFRRFHYATGPIEGPRTTVNAVFLSPAAAEGTIGFSDYPDCGSANASWHATKR